MIIIWSSAWFVLVSEFSYMTLSFARLPIFHDNASKFHTFSDVLRHAISLHAKELKGARALIDGKLVINLLYLFLFIFSQK